MTGCDHFLAAFGFRSLGLRPTLKHPASHKIKPLAPKADLDLLYFFVWSLDNIWRIHSDEWQSWKTWY